MCIYKIGVTMNGAWIISLYYAKWVPILEVGIALLKDLSINVILITLTGANLSLAHWDIHDKEASAMHLQRSPLTEVIIIFPFQNNWPSYPNMYRLLQLINVWPILNIGNCLSHEMGAESRIYWMFTSSRITTSIQEKMQRKFWIRSFATATYFYRSWLTLS